LVHSCQNKRWRWQQRRGFLGIGIGLVGVAPRSVGIGLVGVAPRSVGIGLVGVVPRSWEEEPKFLGDQREEERVKQVVKKENPKQNSWH
jgi:hypothetical protein